MTEDEPGTGGLTFEPPSSPDGDTADMGFAPDLDEDAPNSELWETPAGPAHAREPDAPAPSAGAAAVADARRRRGVGRYPIAEAALDALLGVAPAATPSSPVDDDAPFAVGPDIMRPPPAIQTPAPVREDAPAGAPTRTDELMEDMVDMMLVGDDDDGGGQQIHLAFKEDVFGGLYLKLARTPDGLFATFLVHDDGSRRAVDGHVDTLLSRLRSRGMKIAGHAIEVRDD